MKERQKNNLRIYKPFHRKKDGVTGEIWEERTNVERDIQVNTDKNEEKLSITRTICAKCISHPHLENDHLPF